MDNTHILDYLWLGGIQFSCVIGTELREGLSVTDRQVLWYNVEPKASCLFGYPFHRLGGRGRRLHGSLLRRVEKTVPHPLA